MKKTTIRYQEPGGIIWKVLPDEEGKYLVVESRDGERRRTLLSVVALQENKFLIKEIPAPLPWWIGLKAVTSDRIIFQGYKESQTPEPMGVYVSELLTGKLLWQEKEKVFYTLAEKNSVILSAREEELQLLFKAELSNGKITPIKEGDYTTHVPREISTVFPLLYTEENVYYKTISDFIQQNGYKNSGPIEYLEFSDIIIVSFYIQEGKKMTNILQVIDEEGTIVLEDPLTEGAEGIGMSSFFILNNKLIYVKNKTSLALVAL